MSASSAMKISAGAHLTDDIAGMSGKKNGPIELDREMTRGPVPRFARTKKGGSIPRRSIEKVLLDDPSSRPNKDKEPMTVFVT